MRWLLSRTDTSRQRQITPGLRRQQQRDVILTQWSPQLELIELHGEGEQLTLLVVADRPNDSLQNALADQIHEHFPEQTPQLQLLDTKAYATIQQLIETGILSANLDSARTLYRAPIDESAKDSGQSRRLPEAQDRFRQGDHKRRMAKVLADGGFVQEALSPICEVVETALQALVILRGHDAEIPLELGLIESALIRTNLLPAKTLSLVARLREEQDKLDKAQAYKLLTQSENFLSQAAAFLELGKEPKTSANKQLR